MSEPSMSDGAVKLHRKQHPLADNGVLLVQCNLKQVVQAEEVHDLFSTLDLRATQLDFHAERDGLHRLQEAQDPGRATFSLGSPLYLNLVSGVSHPQAAVF